MNVICQSTSEREKEIRDLFNEIKPLLDEGYSYHASVMKVKGITHKKYTLANLSWYKWLVEYGETQGYPKLVYREDRRRRKR